MGVGSGILHLRGILMGCYLDEGGRLGWVSGAGMKLGRWIGGVTLVGWGRLGIGFAWRWHLSSAIRARAKRGYRASGSEQ